MKLLAYIMKLFKREPIQGPGSGPIFRPIFRRVQSGIKVTDQIDNR
jgi:hypothetical protein